MSRHAHSSQPPVRLAAALSALVFLAACAGPGSTASPATTAQPTPAATSSPSPEPTATPTPRPVAWSSLAWTRADKGSVFGLTDVDAWASGYVGIGQVWDTEDQPTAAFFSSADGLSWLMTQRLTPGDQLLPWRLLTTNDGLLAVVRETGTAPQLWQSTDGSSWQELTSPSWQAACTAGFRVAAVASGPTGLVAVGGSSTGATALFSADGGRTWKVTGLESGVGAEARSVVATANGFVAVGVVGGQPDTQLQQILNGSSAAWTSADGVAWNAASIRPATDADRLTFTAVYAAADGLLAVATDTSGAVPGATAQAWASADGSAWQPLGALGQAVPLGSLAANGVRMLVLDPGSQSPDSASPWPGYLSGWTSLDGRTWTPVSFTGQLMDQDSFDGWWLTDSGLVFSGTNQVWVAVAN